MREAGFSSTAVKNNLEDSNSVFPGYNTTGGIYSTPNSPPTDSHREIVNLNPINFWHSHFLSDQNPNFLFSPNKRPIITSLLTDSSSSSLKEDIKVVIQVFLSKKRRNTVIVSDTLSMAENLVSELMSKVERGDVPDELKSAKLIKFQFSSVPLKYMKREEVEMNIADLKKKVDSFGSHGRVIIYTGDLKWTVDIGNEEDKETNAYSPVDHLIAEMGKLMSGYYTSNTRVWFMATADYQTYIKCQMKQPPLDVQWSLQAVSVPSGGLGLSLKATSDQDSRMNFSQIPLQDLDKKPFWAKDEQEILNCCPECTSNYEKEVGSKSINKETDNASPQLPFWLKPKGIDHTPVKDELVQLRRKYNSLCQRLHQGSHYSKNSTSLISNQCYLGRNYNFTSPYPSWTNKSSIFPDSETISFAAVQTSQTASTLPRFRRQQSCHIEFSFSNPCSRGQSEEPNLDSLKVINDKETKITLALGNSSYTDANTRERVELFKELCGTLQENMPWQSETIPLIAEAVIDSEANSWDKFILLQGNDLVGKRRVAIGIAKSMFGSSDLLLSIKMRDNKRTSAQNREMLEKALKDHEKLVVLVEDVDYADPEFAKFLIDGCLNGKLETPRIQRDSGYAIFVLTMSPDDRNARESMDSVIQMKLLVSENTKQDHKRKADSDFPSRGKIKNPKDHEMEEVSSDAVVDIRKMRRLSPNILDLNLNADENEVKQGEISPISSDLTREISIEQNNAVRFLEKVKNCFVLNRNSAQEARARDMFLCKFERSCQEVEGARILNSFNVEEAVLDRVLQSCGLYLNSMFEQWVKEVFQTSLRMVNNGERGREKVSIRLCLGGIAEGLGEDGFMGTCLPQRIQVSFTG